MKSNKKQAPKRISSKDLKKIKGGGMEGRGVVVNKKTSTYMETYTPTAPSTK